MNKNKETDQAESIKAVAPAATCYASLGGRLLRKWDWWVYRRAYHSLRRMTLDNPGMSYLMELQLRGWNNRLEISPELKRATEAFHSAMEDHRHNTEREKQNEKFRTDPIERFHAAPCSALGVRGMVCRAGNG